MAGEPHDDDAPVRAPFPARLPWHEGLVAELLARRDRWPHALLLQGREGTGKRVLALHLARALLCESPDARGDACGACPGCLYVAAGQHPDLRLVEPLEVDEDGEAKVLESIPIDHVRRLIAFTQVTSHRRGAKVAVIAPAERLRYEAANALLKTLEEPPAGTYLILVAGQSGRLPATVRSRCRVVPVPLPGEAEALAWLSAQGVAAPQTVLAQAGGAPLSALALADPGYQAERSGWLRSLARPEALSPVALSSRIEAGGKDERKDRLAAALDWLLAWTADLGRVRAGGSARQNPDFAAPLAALAARVTPIALLRYHRQLLRQRGLLAHPLQPRLVAEALLIDYRALFD